MTRALRARHRRVAPAMAAALPLVVAVALAARPADPRGALPASLRPALPAPAEPGWSASFAGEGIAVRAVAGRAASARTPRAVPASAPGAGLVLELDVAADTGEPELLAYWAPGASDGDGLPPDAVLLGAIGFASPQRLRLPAAAAKRPGHLVVYDLVRARSAARVAMPPLAGDAAGAIDGDER